MAKLRKTKKVRVINCTCETGRQGSIGESRPKIFTSNNCVCRVIGKKAQRDIPATTVTIIAKKSP